MPNRKHIDSDGSLPELLCFVIKKSVALMLLLNVTLVYQKSYVSLREYQMIKSSAVFQRNRLLAYGKVPF